MHGVDDMRGSLARRFRLDCGCKFEWRYQRNIRYVTIAQSTKNACIIKTVSKAGIMGTPRLAVNLVTKLAVRGLSDALDIEFAECEIRVKCLMLWFIDTPILDMPSRDEANQHM